MILRNYMNKLDLFLSSEGRFYRSIKKVKRIKLEFNNLSLDELEYLLIDVTTDYEHKKRILSMLSITLFISSVTIILSLSKFIIQSYFTIMKDIKVESEKITMSTVLLFLVFVLCVLLCVLIVWLLATLKELKFNHKKKLVLELCIKKKKG